MVRHFGIACLVGLLSLTIVWAKPQHHEALDWDSWQPVTRPNAPPSANSAWVRSPIDAFIAAQHQRQGLTPRPTAPKEVLLRRVYLDLIGLPPTPGELRAFVEDTSPEAYEKVVERLLSSPEYGERWGRHWMDVWRYSDWTGWGEQVRDSMPHIWRWRDWIVESLNRDKPYDRMILEMLAADELAPDDPDALRATGFLVRNYKRLSREQWIEDTVNHASKAFLAVTLECARCHDHMYDPISQDEYFRFRAIFEPHNVRTDRVPGEVNVDKDGLVRAYDAEPQSPTYFYERGDERQADKNRVLSPGVPEALKGPAFLVQEVPLPMLARFPNKRPLVIADDLAQLADQVSEAKREWERSQQDLLQADQAAAAASNHREIPDALHRARREVQRCELEFQLAEARRTSFELTVRAEQLEDQGAGRTDAGWQQAAKDALAAQRRQLLLEKQQAHFAAENTWQQAVAARDAAQRQLSAGPADETLVADFEKAQQAVEEAQKNLAAAVEAVQAAQRDVSAEPTTDYQRRDLPEYPATSTGRRLALARWIADPHNPRTARVAVNHVWMRHFGQPLVPTVFDFGNNGRDHHPNAFCAWLAGAGIRGGVQHGVTDELGLFAVESPQYVTDIHATVLQLLGLDSRRLDIPGRRRLDIDHGTPIREILA